MEIKQDFHPRSQENGQASLVSIALGYKELKKQKGEVCKLLTSCHLFENNRKLKNKMQKLHHMKEFSWLTSYLVIWIIVKSSSTNSHIWWLHIENHIFTLYCTRGHIVLHTRACNIRLSEGPVGVKRLKRDFWKAPDVLCMCIPPFFLLHSLSVVCTNLTSSAVSGIIHMMENVNGDMLL